MQCPRTQLETGQQAEAAAPSTAQRNPLCPITLHEVLDLHTGQLHSLRASRSRPIYWSKSSSWVSSILPPGRADRECARSGGPHFHTRHSSHTADTRLALHWPPSSIPPWPHRCPCPAFLSHRLRQRDFSGSYLPRTRSNVLRPTSHHLLQISSKYDSTNWASIGPFGPA